MRLPRSFALLVLAACTSPTGLPTSDTGAIARDTGSSATASEPERVAIRPARGGFFATQPMMGVDATFTAEGVNLAAQGEAVRFTLRSIGRDGDGPALGEVEPTLADGRLTYAHPGATEWWESQVGGIEVGWDLDRRPPGDGPLTIEIDVEGGDVSGEGDELLVSGSAQLFRIAGLYADDDAGRPLDAWMEATEAGYRVVVDDEGATWPIHVDPTVYSYAWRVQGPGYRYYLGKESAHGDFNGDGYSDLAISQETDQKVFVYHGSSSGLAASPSVTLTQSGSFGPSMASGDINEDGYVDLVVAGYGTPGAVYVYMGSSSGFSTTYSQRISAAGESFGYTVELGDFNGDGHLDLLTGSVTSSGTVNQFNGDGTWIGTSSSVTFTGQYIHHLRSGDFNGDGYDDAACVDMLWGTYYGRVTIHAGSASGLSSAAARTYDGTNNYSGSYLGYALGRAGDFNHDGYDDLLVGDMGYNYGSGQISLYNGSASGLPATASTVYGGSSSIYYGMAASGVGDVNADGYDDALLGSPYMSSRYGQSELHLGGPSGLSSTITGTLTGAVLYDYLGSNAGPAGDVNGDGANDMYIGGWQARVSGNDFAGSGYVVHGSRDGDGDGYTSDDCDDTNSAVHPGATELTGDGVDQNCDGAETCYDDNDNDGYLDTTRDTRASTDADCTDANEGLSSDPTTDCADTNAARYPGATEIPANGVDEDCAGGDTCYADADRDGYGSSSATVSSADLDCVDGGESTTSTDCNDASSAVKPGATEIVGDEADQNCDGAETCYDDDDDDGFLDTTGDTRLSTDTDCDDASEAPTGTPTTDCDDGNAARSPGATEVVGDGIDGDCDGGEDCYDDADNDGYLPGTGATRTSTDGDCADSREGTSSDPTGDCNDASAAIHPGASDTVADGVDGDCDGGDSCYRDGDGDTYGTSTVLTSADLDCADSGESTRTDDCDDSDATTHPGATETPADGVDQDCNTGEVCWVDGDSDGYGGSGLVASADLDCVDVGEHATSTDCDDADARVHPGASDTAANGVDEDCDGGDTCYQDGDGDGFGSATVVSATDLDCVDAGESSRSDDCDDTSASAYPGATETTADGVDQDCDGGDVCWADTDADGYGGATGVSSADLDCIDSGETPTSTDCNDENGRVHPTATESAANGVDEDCDGWDLCFRDGDGDGQGSTTTIGGATLTCTGPGESATSTDCDDSVATTYAGAPELTADGIDQDCDGVDQCYADADGDGQGTTTTLLGRDLTCTWGGEATNDDDCDDTRADVYAGAPEVPADGTDEDCNGQESCYTDDDGDGYGSDALTESANFTCTTAGVSTTTGDCDDAESAVHPGAVEGAADSVDQDCDGNELCYADTDRDGHGSTETTLATDLTCAAGGIAAVDDDCDDDDAAAYPGAAEVPADSVDQDCDGGDSCYADADGDGYGTDATVAGPDLACTGAGESTSAADCDDAQVATFPGAAESCDGEDDNCDGAVDEGLTDCEAGDGEPEKTLCGCASSGESPAGALALGVAAVALVVGRRRTPR